MLNLLLLPLRPILRPFEAMRDEIYEQMDKMPSKPPWEN